MKLKLVLSLLTSLVSAQTLYSQDRRPAIAILGDSLAEGYGVAQGKSFPDGIQRRLDSTGYRYHVVNLGVSGDTSTGGLGRLSYALSLKPAILLLELGGNDGLRGVPVSQTKANLERIIVAAQNAGTQVLLAGMTLPPNYGPDYIRSFENAYKDLAKKYRLPLIPFLMEAIRDQFASRKGLMQGDGIHPTADGHELIADTVMRYLKPMLKAGPRASVARSSL
ncbi:MAG: arylesterase [Bryobacteraceae bacterium]|nr:arylesterase [Bryobacteraceae bacterium]